MTADLVLTGNGPGELAGWARPVARAARSIARQRSLDLQLTMALTPSQFSSGREPQIIREWGLFDRVIEPADSVRLAVRIGPPGEGMQGAVVHLGGDLWFSARLARRFGLPACALAETRLIVRRHRAFQEVFATSAQLADQLVASGVPEKKIVVTGDPRVDAVDIPAHSVPHAKREGGVEGPLPRGGLEYIVSFMPSSRDYLFKALVPYFLRIAGQVGRRIPHVGFQIVVSPFVSPDVVSTVRGEVQWSFPDIDVWWVVGEPWPALWNSDFVLTIPGTNTVELAAAGMPFTAIAPAELIDHLRLEGLENWTTRLPLVGRPLKRALGLRMLSNERFIALPNQRAGRLIAPEWVGAWPEDAFISHLIQLLQDRPRRLEMSNALRQLYAGEREASRRVVDRSLALAGGLSE